MLQVLKTRIVQKHRTGGYPDVLPDMPPKYIGLPVVGDGECADDCSKCLSLCPVGALEKGADGYPSIDVGKCVFCGKCAEVCREHIIEFTKEHRMTADKREDLRISRQSQFRHAEAVRNEILRLFKRSFKLRQVCAGGCGACEADTNVLGTVGFDLGRFGISFVASPRHADGLLVTGPVTKNMRSALLKTYEAVPDPKIVIAVGACAVSGGLFAESPETAAGVGEVIPVDYYVPGCPPHPLSILDGLLTVLNRNNKQRMR